MNFYFRRLQTVRNEFSSPKRLFSGLFRNGLGRNGCPAHRRTTASREKSQVLKAYVLIDKQQNKHTGDTFPPVVVGTGEL